MYVVRMLKVYSQQLLSMQCCVITLVAELYIKSSELTLLIVENVYSLNYINPFLIPPAPDNHHSIFQSFYYFYEISFFLFGFHI